MAKINETLRQLRTERGMTQEEVAEQVGLTRQAVSGYESGRTQPGLDILQRLADIYEVDLTDIIYGRDRSPRLRKATKAAAIVMGGVVLAAQLGEALLRWLANYFFPIEPGIVTAEEKLLLEARFRLGDVYSGLEGFYLTLFPLFCIVLLVMTLFLPRPAQLKTKLLCAAGFSVASMAVVLPWALTDRVFSPVDYLIAPAFCLSQLVFFLILSLVIDLVRARRRQRKKRKCQTPRIKVIAPHRFRKDHG